MKKRVCLAILTMGFSGLVAEILLLREFLIVFSGNEFSIGIILANWLLLESFGAFILGRRTEKLSDGLHAFTTTNFVFSITLALAIFLVRLLRTILGFSIGEPIGLFPILYSSFILLLPVSVSHGALFTFSCHLYSRFSNQDPSSAGKVYAYETVGTVLGGIVCTYLLIPHLHTFQAISGLALLNALICLFLVAPYAQARCLRTSTLTILGVFALSALALATQANKVHLYSIKAQWRDLNVVHYQNSPYGNICVVENEGQYIFFQDGMPDIITPIPDMPFVEGLVHLPLLAQPEPRSLLVLSGGVGGVIGEALKHPTIEVIEYAELDPLLIDLFRKFSTPLTEDELTDTRVHIKHIDGCFFLRTTRNAYDVILVGITEPSTLQTNRFFTQEFFTLAQARLNEGGILVIGLPGSLTYMSQELKDLNSCIFHTLRSVFPYVRVFPGDGTNLFLSSNSPEIAAFGKVQVIDRLHQRGMETQVALPWYIEQKLHSGWQTWFAHLIEGGSQKINTALHPIGLFYVISNWNALFAPSLRPIFRHVESISLGSIILSIAFLLIVYLFIRARTRRLWRVGVPFSVLTTGFAGMIFDLMIIFAFQSVYGYVFSWVGLLVAAFMAGAACGAILSAKFLERASCFRLFVGIELALILFSTLFLALVPLFHTYSVSPGLFFMVRLLFLLLSFFGGLLIGSQFPLANKLYLNDGSSLTGTAGLLYAADLLGGWLAGIVGSVVLLPILGLVGAALTVASLKVASLIILTTQAHWYALRGR